jgi:hypothetical protein
MSSCKNYFVAHDFDSKTANHKTVAVLPVKMIFTGKQPKNITEEQIKELEVAESKAFQIALHDEILASTRGGKKPIRVAFQSYTETLKLLKDNNISIRDSWDMDPKQLAQLLNVDAVVKMDVTKKRYISDLASFGLSVGREIINVIGLGIPTLYGGVNRIGRTNDVIASAKVINMSDGMVLWSKSDTQSTDWSNPAETVVRYMCRRIGRDFPYRIAK